MIADAKAHFQNVARLRCKVAEMAERKGFRSEVSSIAYACSPGCYQNDVALVYIWKKRNKLGPPDCGLTVSGISKVAA